jgi:PEP-CTERM/exosortase A-associated glycosyltransferase
MKILHIFDHTIPLQSGYTFRSLSILKHQRDLGIETCHVSGDKQGATTQTKEHVDGYDFYRTPVGALNKIPVVNQWQTINSLAKRIVEVAQLEKPDILHAHSPALNGLAALKASKQLGIPVVYEIRAFWEDAAVDHGTCKEGDVRYRITRHLENRVVSQANGVTTICEGLKNDLISRALTPNQPIVIPNAVNAERFTMVDGRDAELEAELNLQGKKVIGFIGSMYAYEGIDTLVSALSELVKSIPDVQLLLVGGGPQYDNIEQQVKELGLTNNVIFTGRVAHEDVNRYYSLFDLLVYPRQSMRLTDLVTPLKPLEAMAQGVPLLASDVGGHQELIEDGVTGYLFEADNQAQLVEKLQYLLSKTDLGDSTRENGRNFVEQVRNWKVSVGNYPPLYEQVLTNT